MENKIKDMIKKQMETLENLSKNKTKSEGVMTGLFLKEPTLLLDYDINVKLLSEAGVFYIGIVNRLLKKGIEVIDEISFASEVELLNLKDKYIGYGGYQTVKEMANIVDARNADGIIDDWNKWNLVDTYNNKGLLNIAQHWNKILNMNSSQLVDYVEHQNADIDIKINTDIIIEDLNMTDKEIEDTLNGINMGINFGKHSPILNYLSMGLPKGDLTMFASFSNGGKSSYIMNNVIIPTAEQRIKSVIIANEQKSIVYKMLLQTYVLTERLDYWKLTRKKFKSGDWTEEDKIMVQKAREIIKNEYAPYIQFVKLYDYDMSKISKIAKKLSKTGLEILLYDTMKYGGGDDNSVWLSLIEDSKEIFQICSKLNLSGVVSFQLAPALKNKLRTLDETALANGKQVKEVFSEMFAFRDVWDDEWNGEPFDIKPYRLKKDSNGKYTGDREEIVLDKEKVYKIFFHFKTRNDQVGNAIVYEFKGYQNKWIEIGYCRPHQKNRF